MKMGLIVQKFGGTSVADTERLRNVARIITDTYKAGNQVVVVLSAQGDTTDDLIEKAKEINPEGSNREMDMLLSTGEQISVALCAMAIGGIGISGSFSYRLAGRDTYRYGSKECKDQKDRYRASGGRAGPEADCDRYRFPGSRQKPEHHYTGKRRF